MTGLSYTGEQVRSYDHDRFLTVIFAPPATREHLFALYAFNIEIAKTREVVTEPLIGRMRLQWWRDALDRLYAGETVAHEVARPLGEAIHAASLERAPFDRLIDAREADLDDAPPADLAALEAYAAATSAPLLELAVQAAGGRNESMSAEATEAIRSVAIAWALTGLMRAVPFHAQRRRLYLPQDRLAAASVSIGRLFDLKPDEGLQDVVRGVSTRALTLLREGRAGRHAIPRMRRPPMLLAKLADLYLADLRRAHWDPFAPALRRGRPLAPIRLAASATFGLF